MAHMLEQLVGEQMGIWEEMVKIQESSERQEDILQDLVNQTKASLDAMELFMWGEHFLRVLEMEKLEGPGEVENVLWRQRRRLGTRSKEKELERNPERSPEMVPEADLEMILH